MTDRQTFHLVHQTARNGAIEAVRHAPEGYCVQVRPKTRSLEQNSILWALLQKLSDQVDWHGQKLSPDDWKDIITASLRKQRAAPGIDGGFVVFGERTRNYSKAEFSELIELIYCFGAQQGVNFDE